MVLAPEEKITEILKFVFVYSDTFAHGEVGILPIDVRTPNLKQIERVTFWFGFNKDNGNGWGRRVYLTLNVIFLAM